MTEQEVLIDIRERLVRVETKLDNNNDLRDRVSAVEDKTIETDARAKSNTHRIDGLEANNSWLWRTISGSIIAAVIGVFIALVKMM